MAPNFKELINPLHSAVLVIDNQNDSCHPDGIYARSGRDISLRQKAAHNTAEFIKEARKYKVPIIFIKVSNNKWTNSPVWMRQPRIEGAQACQEGTWGEQFYAAQPLLGEAIVTKHRYSAFIGTDLDMILRSHRIKTLIATGGGTQACVEATARDGFMLDYNIVVVSDCCGTPSIEEHELALKRMANLCGVVVESKQLLQAWATK